MRDKPEVQEHAVSDWESFEATITEIDRQTRELKRMRDLHVSQPLYRGQRDASWHLTTTLERRKPAMTLATYLAIMERIQPQIERVSGRRWPRLSQEISALRRNGLDSIWLFPVKDTDTQTILSFMVHLRQHGFPSPLLDWTSDPYRAAFFAFAGTEEGTQRVAIFTFREWAGSMPEFRGEHEITVMGIGPHILNTTQRHSRQRAQYTWCVKKSALGECLDSYIFDSHEVAVNLSGFHIENGRCVDIHRASDIVDKYTIPASERKTVLASLAERNINTCRLLGRSTDSLLQDLWNELVVDCTV